MVDAVFNGQVVAASGAVVRIKEDIRISQPAPCPGSILQSTRMKSLCPWKVVASYYTVWVDRVESQHAAWSYRHPSPLAWRIENHVAFWKCVQIVDPDQRDTAEGFDLSLATLAPLEQRPPSPDRRTHQTSERRRTLRPRHTMPLLPAEPPPSSRARQR